jgi:peroxiredoxin
MKRKTSPTGPWLRGLCLFIILVPLIAFMPTESALAADALKKGGVLPDFELPMPSDSNHLSYLGLKPSQGKTFRLDQIKQKWLLIEIFNMYCTICQGEAREVNQLYEKIRQSPLKDKLAMIGIGVGNSPFEVKVFRKRYGIEFPLFPDGDFKVHKALIEPRTPHFLLVHVKDGENRIILSNVGPFGKPADFIKDLQEAIEAK